MKGRDLAAEMAAAGAAVRQGHIDRLRGLGVSLGALATLNAQQPTIGVGRVELHGDGLFTFCEDGEGALVQAVCEDCEVIDLIAWRSDNPSRWWWRVGTGYVLGGDLLQDFGDTNAGLYEGVPVVATPANWLACAGLAVAVLDWDEDSPVWPLLRRGPALVFDDDLLRQRVRKALLATAPLPHMSMRNLENAA